MRQPHGDAGQASIESLALPAVAGVDDPGLVFRNAQLKTTEAAFIRNAALQIRLRILVRTALRSPRLHSRLALQLHRHYVAVRLMMYMNPTITAIIMAVLTLRWCENVIANE